MSILAAREMPQSVKFLLYEWEDPSFISKDKDKSKKTGCGSPCLLFQHWACRSSSLA